LAGGGLWERESEVTALGAAFGAAASGTSQLVLVEGPAGIGKSRLLTVARLLAAERNLPVLAAFGLELEREVPFGVARQLFVPSLLRASGAERASLLAGPAALAEPLLDGFDADARVGEGQAGALVEGLHWLAVNLAQAHADASSPARLAIIVDDAQWADRPSLRFLAHMAGRTGGDARSAGSSARPARLRAAASGGAHRGGGQRPDPRSPFSRCHGRVLPVVRAR
jgi:predicted ATPase